PAGGPSAKSALVRHPNGTSLVRNLNYIKLLRIIGDFGPLRPSSAAAAEGAEKRQSRWHLAIKLVTFGEASIGRKMTCGYASAIRRSDRSRLIPGDDITPDERGVMVRNAAQFGLGVGPGQREAFGAKKKLGPAGPHLLSGGTWQ